MDLKEKYKKEFTGILQKNKDGDNTEIIDFFRVKRDNLDELVVKCILWGHYFMPKYFSKPTPDFHYELVRRFFKDGNDYMACPRGFGKTSIVQLCVAFSCANGLDKFIVLIEKGWNEAAEVLEAVREEFKLNDEIVSVYGDLTRVNIKGNVQDNIKDSAGDFFINGVRLRSKGFDAPIRGLKSRSSRPSTVILDDVESDEHIDNVEQRQKYLNNYVKGIIPAVDNDTGCVKVFGTILHDDSLLNTLIKNHNGLTYRAWDNDRILLWPSNWTVEKLEQKRIEMRIEGKGDASFYQEYFNEPISDEDQIFRREMFRYFNSVQLEELKKKPHRIYTLVDPAISKKTTADFTAIVSVMVDFMNKVYILEITRERLDPIETIKAIFAHYERWQPTYVGIETVSYQKALKYFIEEEKRRQNSSVQSMQIQEIKPTTDKVTKIKKLQPKYAIANVYHNSNDPNTPILEQELLRFPVAAHDDVIDALSGVIEIMTPVSKTIDREYKKFSKIRETGCKVSY
jgi:predicted phage terminase large subunit-like protein